MANEDNLDQLYALYIANNIMTARLWQYLASISAQHEGLSEIDFLRKHLKLSIESVDRFELRGHRSPEYLRNGQKAEYPKSRPQ